MIQLKKMTLTALKVPKIQRENRIAILKTMLHIEGGFPEKFS